ncbi:HXXEE domain-containing protein [Mesorhizobium sp. M9A.F.Ca.ET.002.03.1.2]|uniref:HXXEE domain-containing protein n=1 Tax=Mesorhizobium sp. M9A.F.Ca.ET.002.03.1.2 TaxID=2493668 RepID=UPI0016735B62|nr:HXXEE domain-containing protein [Mesorhizobium sp. M9A.F.Ca.ET.002.03.1.2]
MTWFLRNWMYAGFIAGLFLLAITPILADALVLPVLFVYLQLPAYMLHQLEEHHDDRFRRFINDGVAGVREALSTPAVVVINVGVWVVNLIALYLARFVDLGWGLIAIYLTLINALVHILAAMVQRRYNPGLVTAVVLFLPVGLYALMVISRMPDVTTAMHVVALVFAILAHAAIGVHVKRRAATLSAGAARTRADQSST